MAVFAFLPACKKEVRTASLDEINFSFHEQNFGASAGELLKDDAFTSLAVEVQYMQDFKPDEKAIENLKIFLSRHLHKPGGIFFYEKEIKPVADTILSRKQVDSIRRANRTVYTKGKMLALYILYTNGEFENPHVFGQAFRNTSIVIYGRTIMQYAHVFSFPSQTTIENNPVAPRNGALTRFGKQRLCHAKQSCR